MNEFEREKTQYLGIPVLDAEEFFFLIQNVNDDSLSAGNTTIDQLFEKVYNLNPRLEEVIGESVEVAKIKFRDSVRAQFMDFVEAGVWDGYRFVIGALTFVQQYRSGLTNFDEFAAQQREAGSLLFLTENPRTTHESESVEELLGAIGIENALTAHDATKSLGSRYLFASDAFNTLKKQKEATIIKMISGRKIIGEEGVNVLPAETTALLKGFSVGHDHALAIYTRSYENRILGDYTKEFAEGS